MWKRKEGKLFLLFKLALLLACLLFPFYSYLTKLLSPRFSGCMMHDYLFLYCPMCGGTRAISALLQLRILDALCYNALVVLLSLFALVLDAVALVRLLQKKQTILRFAHWHWIALAVALVLFGVLRNLLMIGFSIDPLGDLGGIWKMLKK